ncbi:TIM21-domain-containing protein [Abortiporus biennis]|nr:TIM21-domain-containing protein [Abortiporus biennis]
MNVPSSLKAGRLLYALSSKSTACGIRPWIVVCRSLATRQPTSRASLLSQALDQKQRAARREDSVGPFQLGFIPPTQQDVGEVKKWSELSTGGKVIRSTARTTNLVVILLGAGLSAVLVYALTSELFSKNSATVLYGQACEHIKSSPRVAKYLQGPLTFHNNPPMSIRPRHRNHLSSQIVVDADGREHMLLNFYVQGQPPGSTSLAASTSYVDHVISWTKDAANQLSQMSIKDVVENTKARGLNAFDSFKEMFRFLSGENTESQTRPSPVSVPEKNVERKEEGWMSSFTGLFHGLKGGSSAAEEKLNDVPYSPSDIEGEVHVDLIMNDQGYFDFRYILIDFPDSSARNPRRVFVLRAPGVYDSERVLRWHRG